jgi:hypothetical protein
LRFLLVLVLVLLIEKFEDEKEDEDEDLRDRSFKILHPCPSVFICG